MSKILQTKAYMVQCGKGPFKLFVSEHDDGNCFAAVLYYDKQGAWAEGKDVILGLKSKMFADLSIDSVTAQAKQWIKQSLAPDATIVPAE